MVRKHDLTKERANAIIFEGDISMQSATADKIQKETSDEDIDFVSDDEEVQQQEENAEEFLFYLKTGRLGEAVPLDEPEWNPFTDHFLPFKTIESMIMHVLMNGDNDMISEKIDLSDIKMQKEIIIR
ncbi:hypothetical protein EDC96DRAFT_580397 [Choanephora cucurbitarum]|nr:hypothetical protein EDC96DRAFT_580397 [Choanephora cucurbitarum]